jgi:hypothetical protein
MEEQPVPAAEGSDPASEATKADVALPEPASASSPGLAPDAPAAAATTPAAAVPPVPAPGVGPAAATYPAQPAYGAPAATAPAGPPLVSYAAPPAPAVPAYPAQPTYGVPAPASYGAAPAGPYDAAPADASAGWTAYPANAQNPPAETPARRSRGAKVAVWLLSAALLLLVGAGTWLVLQYVAAQELISEQEDEIRQQEDEIEQQRELIDEKESFGAAMTALMVTTEKFSGVLTASVVPWDSYDRLVERAWSHRWDAVKLAADTGQVELETEQLELAWTTAQTEAASNASGTTYEAVIDSLGDGFVRSVLDTESCGDDQFILGCVYENDPYLVHFDAVENTQPYMTDEIRTGIAYHEFAHVLQFTNPDATEVALEAFAGDWEVMADCFALTYLPGWKLDHVVWTSSYEYWDVNIGYGVTCTEPQRQAVRDWYAQLGVKPQTVGAED